MQSFTFFPRQRTIPVVVESWGWTQQGNIKTENQDSFLNWAEGLLWAVADGVGGSEHGGAASHLIAKHLTRVATPDSLDTHIKNVRNELKQINSLVHEGSQKMGTTAASTVVVLLMGGNEAACLWAGDSRCYLFRDGLLYQCTRDHTLRQQKVDQGELTVDEAKRMVQGNIITKAVGIGEDMELDEVRFSLKAGDRFLLCTDGLFNILGGEAISHYMGRQSAQAALEGFKEAIHDREQPDNITFIVVYLSVA
ncbi:MAG: serine/threonine-protein phosphatase [Betaproteobacteria bacterium]|nr:serine/threonine-protein phosphatase [Betaproteobacteria bacterium]